MNEKTLKFNKIRLNNKEFHRLKEPIDLSSVHLGQIVAYDNFRNNVENLKHFIGYLEGKIVKPLCIILPQMVGYIKYFETVVKTCVIWLKIMKCGINMLKFGMWFKTN